jgi:deoxyribodipyrimidine photo-lyase
MSSLCWIRRDLRLHDHAALSHALNEGETTLVFVFDPLILDKLKHKDDRRVTFIMESLREMEVEVQKLGSSIIIRYGKPEIEIPKLARDLKVTTVYSNRDYEPYAKERDSKVEKALTKLNIGFEQFKDAVFFEKTEVLSNTGSIYKVFTPYKNKWIENFEQNDRSVPNYKCKVKNLRLFKNTQNVLQHNWFKDIGMKENPPLLSGGTKEALKRLKKFQNQIENYADDRNFPAIPGTSLL